MYVSPCLCCSCVEGLDYGCFAKPRLWSHTACRGWNGQAALGVRLAFSNVHFVQGSSGNHEDEIMQAGLDEMLAQEETAEQDVLAQLRQRAASLERDLLQRSLDGLAPNSKVQILSIPICSCCPQSQYHSDTKVLQHCTLDRHCSEGIVNLTTEEVACTG